MAKEVFRFAHMTMGSFDYGIMGMLLKRYKKSFLVSCIRSFPVAKLYLSEKEKTIYLAGMCRNKYTANDINKDTKDLDFSGFKLG